MKVAPIMRAFKEKGNFQTLLVHTGQHYDESMSRLFFEELDIPEPDINLEVGSSSHAEQTAEIMKRFEPVVQEFRPDYVLVVGDVNSTIACGLVAVKLGVKLIHVEAGLRSFDRTMPEEINRLLTDAISDLLFVTEQSGMDNLRNEGINSEKVQASRSDVLERLELSAKEYAVITLHRPSNVDEPEKLGEIMTAFEEIQKEMKLVFPIHPRTRNNIRGTPLGKRLEEMGNLLLLEPVGYLDFLCLMSNAALVMTDSGGIQEETTILGVPCMTLRKSTERPVTITEGTNQLCVLSAGDIVRVYKKIMDGGRVGGRVPKFWDGKAAQRIARIIAINKAGEGEPGNTATVVL
jgi:UDP-N-acetylglucosamine 2-epimerase (non-hydrolysing)